MSEKEEVIKENTEKSDIGKQCKNFSFGNLKAERSVL